MPPLIDDDSQKTGMPTTINNIKKKKKTIPTMQTYKRRNFKQEKKLVKRTDQYK